MESLYLREFGFGQDPFRIAPDPSFLYLSASHREALAQLEYGIQARKGFVVLTGEVGTGKTTLVRTLFEKLEGNTRMSFVYNTIVSPKDLLRYVCEDLGILPYEGHYKEMHDYLTSLNRFLLEAYQRGDNVGLVIDEAQNLSAELLESVRLLSNFEASKDKLLQILLVGQPELREKLDRPELRQLKQRIAVRCVIRPLTPEETGDYIRFRLRMAGAIDLGLFTDRAVLEIAEYAQGIPRLVNVVCDHCLLIAYADRKREIDTDIVDEAVASLENGKPLKGRWPRLAREMKAMPLFRWVFGRLQRPSWERSSSW